MPIHVALQWTAEEKMDTPVHPTQSFVTPGSQEGIRPDTAAVNKAFLGIRQAGRDPHWEAWSAHQARSGVQGSAGSSEQSAMGQGSGWVPPAEATMEGKDSLGGFSDRYLFFTVMEAASLRLRLWLLLFLVRAFFSWLNVSSHGLSLLEREST